MLAPFRSHAHRGLARLLLLAVASVLLGACGESSQGAPGLGQVDVASAVELPDGATPTGDAPEKDTSPADATPTALPAGAACGSDAECAVGLCLESVDGARCAELCADGACPAGLECARVVNADGFDKRACVDPFVALCQPCRADVDCATHQSALGASRCLAFGHAGRFCGAPCGVDRPACPEGYGCAEDGQCRPNDGVCDRCTPRAVALGAETSCSSLDHPADCIGTRICTADGLAPCDLPPFGPEVCNGRDDDCDGVVDNLPPEACGGFACGGAAGCLDRCETNADCAPGLACDASGEDAGAGACVADGSDGTFCADASDCASGYCAGGYCCAGPEGLCCATDGDCVALDEAPVCTDRAADGCAGFQAVSACVAAICAREVVDTPSGCVDTQCLAGVCDDDVFHAPRRCTPDGGCEAPVAPALCDDLDPCTVDACSPTAGCTRTPRTGPGEGPCYTHDPTTRGVGACHDGVKQCVDGLAVGCLGEQGPVAEVCNGVDDDCDGQTDEGTAASCAPYVCAGVAGCATSCEGDAGCVAGHYCDDGACVSAGVLGSPCANDGQCVGGRCDNQFCCAAGTCCAEDGDCAGFAALHCSQATAQGCTGTRTEGVCDSETKACGSTTTVDPAGCAGSACQAASCAEAVLKPGASCDGAGACVAAGPPVECAPYLCLDGACATSCEQPQDCAPGATCDASGQCLGATLDGGACSSDEQCLGGHCANGYCCASGACCASDADCVGFDEAPVCADAAACSGSQVVGRCVAAKRCEKTTVAAPAACVGRVCGGTTCKNLSGLAIVLEGIARERCDVAGACKEVVEDCRDLASGAYCSGNSAFYSWCERCTPQRSACVVLTSPCYCE